MMDTVTATRKHAEKQQARTAEEKEAELREEVSKFAYSHLTTHSLLTL